MHEEQTSSIPRAYPINRLTVLGLWGLPLAAFGRADARIPGVHYVLLYIRIRKPTGRKKRLC